MYHIPGKDVSWHPETDSSWRVEDDRWFELKRTQILFWQHIDSGEFCWSEEITGTGARYWFSFFCTYSFWKIPVITSLFKVCAFEICVFGPSIRQSMNFSPEEFFVFRDNPIVDPFSDLFVGIEALLDQCVSQICEHVLIKWSRVWWVSGLRKRFPNRFPKDNLCCPGWHSRCFWRESWLWLANSCWWRRPVIVPPGFSRSF